MAKKELYIKSEGPSSYMDSPLGHMVTNEGLQKVCNAGEPGKGLLVSSGNGKNKKKY